VLDIFFGECVHEFEGIKVQMFFFLPQDRKENQRL